MRVRAIIEYFDMEMNMAVKALDEFEVSAERAAELAGPYNRAKQPLVEIIEETPPTKKVAKAAPKKKKAVKDE